MKVPVGYKCEWELTAEPYDTFEGCEVWFRMACGPMSGGVLLTPEQAVSLGNMLIEAAHVVASTNEAEA